MSSAVILIGALMVNYKVKSQTYCRTFNTCDVVSETKAHVKLLRWPIIH